jgi:hypothetical protein
VHAIPNRLGAIVFDETRNIFACRGTDVYLTAKDPRAPGSQMVPMMSE